jgi:hypothetical protein
MQNWRSSQDFWILDLATPQSRRVTELDPLATIRTFDITPDGERIVFDRLKLDSDIVLIELSILALRMNLGRPSGARLSWTR